VLQPFPSYLFWLNMFFCIAGHRDTCYADFAFFWTVGCILMARDNPQAAGPSSYTTCSMTQRHAQANPPAAHPSLQPNGGNFYAAGVQVLVMQSPGTLCAFRPGEPHGTTVSDGVKLQGLSITFSEHIKKAYERAVEGGLVIEHSQVANGPN